MNKYINILQNTHELNVILIIEITVQTLYKKSTNYVTGVHNIINGMNGAIIRSVFSFFYV
jgi:hypothetical protein